MTAAPNGVFQAFNETAFGLAETRCLTGHPKPLTIVQPSISLPCIAVVLVRAANPSQ